ncbi:hypothetical protein CDEF62S_00137 [Castellaniella defragrans]
MKQAITRRTFLNAVGIGTLSAVFPPIGRAAGAREPRQLILANADSSMSVGTAVYTTIPKGLGLYEKHNISFQQIPITGAGPATQAVAAKRADISSSGVTGQYPSMLKDPNLRIVAMYNGFYQLAVPDSSPIKTLADVRGKTIGIQNFGTGSYLYAQAILRSEGLDPAKDVQWLPVGLGAQSAEAYRKGDIQIFGLWDTTNTSAIQLLGERTRVIPSVLNYYPGLSAFITRKDVLQEKRQLLVDYLACVWEAVRWTNAGNWEEAVEIHWKMIPEVKPRGNQEVALRNQIEILKNRLPIYLPKEGQPYGYLTDNRIEDGMKLLLENGLLKEGVPLKPNFDLSVAKESNVKV